MSIEIRTYDGDAEQLSRFVVGTWLKSYQGKMSVPDWSPRYFDWQLTGDHIQDRELLVTAWKGDRLIGTILAMPFPLWINSQQVKGAQGSWLSVDAEFRRDGVASLMVKELNRRQLDRNYYGRLGYAFQGSKKSEGPKFWRSGRTNTNFIRPMYLWARVLNGKAVRRWTDNAIEKFALSLLPSFVYQVPSPKDASYIREYEVSDLPACLELINSQAKKTDLANLWTESRLRHQLNYPELAETLVVEREGEVIGFLNFHLLDLILQGRITSAVIDLFACENLSASQSYHLLLAALQKMESLGVDLVLMREFASQPKISLYKARFLPQFSDSFLMLNRASESKENLLLKSEKIQILWR